MTLQIFKYISVLALVIGIGDWTSVDPYRERPPSAAQSVPPEVAEATVVAKMVNQNHDAALKALDQAEQEEQNSARGPASIEQPHVMSKVIVVNGANGYDPGAEDKIKAMNIPDKVKDEILRNYRKTGVMPNFETPH